MKEFAWEVNWRGKEWNDDTRPVGRPCFACEEPIAQGDQGQWIGNLDVIEGQRKASVAPVHKECLALSVIGHQYGVCGCNAYAGTSTKREAALELWRRLRLRAGYATA